MIHMDLLRGLPHFISYYGLSICSYRSSFASKGLRTIKRRFATLTPEEESIVIRGAHPFDLMNTSCVNFPSDATRFMPPHSAHW